jgi:uncharacterized cupin superfamily protein
MKHVQVDNVPWFEWTSPTGKFAGAGRPVSEALGAIPGATIAKGGPQFDLEMGQLAPGKSCCPFHRHSAQSECYYTLKGTGEMRHGEQRRKLQLGDVALHPPGSSHQIINTGDTDLIYYLVADNPLTEFCYYPDSNKWDSCQSGSFFAVKRLIIISVKTKHLKRPPHRPNSPCRKPLLIFSILQISNGSIAAHLKVNPKAIAPISHSRSAPHAMQACRRAAIPSICSFARFQQVPRSAPTTATACSGNCSSLPPVTAMCARRKENLRSALAISCSIPHGLPHQTMAAEDSELECLIITDNPLEELGYYPDSDKWGAHSVGKYFRLTETDYFDGEE